MRLINTWTLRLEEFQNAHDVKYAILSHKWEDDEVTFQDFETAAGGVKKGFEKIMLCCDQARRDGLDYAWVDTCCIDKTSSAELSEAINSMFEWYEHSIVCYVYLSDVTTNINSETVLESFSSSAWFTRGWTLQELLAPQHVRFYDADWQLIGDKDDESLLVVISGITGIEMSALAGRAIGNFSVAQRMSWAASRKTTRTEDAAYSLLGIFGIHMPLLYGEGHRAFRRLQEEIMRQCVDHTIFGWTNVGSLSVLHNMLAERPENFRGCGQVLDISRRMAVVSPYSMTNLGLSITMDLTPWTCDTYLALLSCCDNSAIPANLAPGGYQMGIFLQKDAKGHRYIRVPVEYKYYTHLSREARERRPWRSVAVTIRDTTALHDRVPVSSVYGFRLRSIRKMETGRELNFITVPNGHWEPRTRTMIMKKGQLGPAGYLRIKGPHTRIRSIRLGFDFDFNPAIFVVDDSAWTSEPAEWMSQDFGQFESTSGWCQARQAVVKENPGLKGHWAFKGDRIHGLHVSMINYEADFGVTIQIVRTGVRYDSLGVWEVDIAESESPIILENMRARPSRTNSPKVPPEQYPDEI